MDFRPHSLSLIALAGALSAGCRDRAAPPPPAAPVVRVVEVRGETMPVPYTCVGRTFSNNKVDVVARVTGELIEAPFTDGSKVNAGDVLYRLDDTEYRARLDEAEARLEQMKARLIQAQADLDRIEPLAAAGASPRQVLDTARTTLLAAKADLRAAEAAVINARLTLSYTTIRAPIAGRTGKSSYRKGTLITPQSGSLLVIDDTETMFVEFTISEKDMLSHRREIEAGTMQTVARDRFRVKAMLLDGKEFKETGHIDFSDIHVAPETGTALLRATFPNPEGELRPGQFVRVRLVGVTRKDALLVPQEAVLQGPAGASVYVVDAAGLAQSRPVKLGAWSGDRWHIASGLTPGDRVITGGVQRVRPGAPVNVAPDGAAAR